MKVLDYGFGSALSLLEARALGGEPYGVETDPNVARIAEHYKLNVHIGPWTQDVFRGVKFDLIVLNQVIEHVPEPGKLLQSFKERLNEDGRLVMSFPNASSIYRRVFGRRWINWHIPYHLHHFCWHSFRRLAAQSGYEIQTHRTVTPNLWTVLQLRARSQAVEPGMANSMWGGASREVAPDSGAARPHPTFLPFASGKAGRLITRVVGVAKSLAYRLARVGATALIGTANRTVDALGLGDSFIVVLRPRGKY
jgi:hypothetical protein